MVKKIQESYSYLLWLVSESVIGELDKHIKSLKNMCITETSSKVHGLSLSYPQIRDADPILQI